MKRSMRPVRPAWLLPILSSIAIWEIFARAQVVPAYFFPPFSAVMAKMYQLLVSGVLTQNLTSSLIRVLAGLLIGSISGVAMGILMGSRETINKMFHPIFSLLMPIPALGWAPLFMLWIGINEALPIALVFMCSFFPLLYNTITGIKEVDKDYIKVAKTLNASEWKILTTIILPLALPNILTGLRLEAGMAWRVIVAAEMVAIPTGIGALLIRSESLLRVDVIMVCLIVLSVMCLLFEKSLQFLEHLIMKWKVTS